MNPALLDLDLDTTGTGPAVLVKYTRDVAGVSTSAGSPALVDAPSAPADAEAVRRLHTAGWRIAGKKKLHELVFGTTGINLHDGTPVNPRWPDRVPVRLVQRIYRRGRPPCSTTALRWRCPRCRPCRRSWLKPPAPPGRSA